MTNTVDLVHYSAALDEIYRLRCALVYEAYITEVHLGYATFPKGRRPAAEAQIQRMRAAARGETRTVYAERATGYVAKELLAEAGAPTTLTRGAWEQGRASAGLSRGSDDPTDVPASVYEDAARALEDIFGAGKAPWLAAQAPIRAAVKSAYRAGLAAERGEAGHDHPAS